jgi:hypothetical protein
MRFVATTALAAALAAGAASPAQAQQDDFRWSGRIAEGNQVRIQGIAGSVRAEHTGGDRVEVVARRGGRDAARMEVRTVETADGVTVCAVFAGGEEGRDRCSSRWSGRRGGDRESFDARVDFVVRVPAGVRLNVAVVAGDVDATGLRSPVEVSAVSGDVRIATTGTARANTVSGDIDATFATGGEMDFNSVSGDVTLRLASGAGARVSANTLSGSIESDFELERGARSGSRGGGVNVEIGRRASGTIGRGGPALGVNTVSGDIRILRAR